MYFESTYSKRFFSCVSSRMSFEITKVCKTMSTDCTRKRPFTSMYTMMSLEIVRFIEYFTTIFTREHFNRRHCCKQRNNYQLLYWTSLSKIFNNHRTRLSMIARIIKAKVCVICRNRRLRRITQSEASIISLSCENRIQYLFYYTFINVEAFRKFTK